MNSTTETHYISTFKKHPAIGLERIRRTALEEFRKAGFPTNRQEDWRNLDLKPVTEEAFSVAEQQQPIDYFDDLDFPYLAGVSRMVFVNGIYTPELSDLTNLPEQVILTSLSNILAKEPDKVQARIDQSPVNTANTFRHLNTAFFKSGFWLEIPNHLDDKISLQIIYLSKSSTERPICNLRNIVNVGTGSNLHLVEHYLGYGISAYFNNVVNDIQIAADARLEHIRIQSEADSAYQVSDTTISQGENSRVNSIVFSLGGALVRNNLTLNLIGEGADGHINGLYLNRNKQVVDNHTLINHSKPNCTSGEIYKGIIDDNGQAIFNGKIIVQPDAQKTDARQINRNLLLSPEARANANPQLEIYADDVKCTHGATTGHLDEDGIFYLRSRGIDIATSQALLINGFAREVLNTVADPASRDLVGQLVNDWFAFDAISE